MKLQLNIMGDFISQKKIELKDVFEKSDNRVIKFKKYRQNKLNKKFNSIQSENWFMVKISF